MTMIAHPTSANISATAGEASAIESGIPWYIWAVAFASTSVLVGVVWDTARRARLLAPHDRARHVLDSRSSCDLSGRHGGRVVMWLVSPEDNLRRQ